MISTKTAIVAKTNEVRAYCKAKKKLEIKAKYETELAMLDINSFPPQPKFWYWLLSNTPLKYPVLSQPKASYITGQTSIVVVFSNSNFDISS